MNKMKKLLSVLLAIVMILSSMTVMASAAKTAYKTVDELNALDAYSPYGQVTRLSTEERTSVVFDALDNLLAPMTSLNMGRLLNLDLVITKLTLDVNLTSVDGICDTFDSIKSLFTNGLFSVAKAILNFGDLEKLNVSTWDQTGMSRDGTDQFTILSEIFEALSAQGNLIDAVLSDGLDLGMIASFLGSLDLSGINEMIVDLPGMVKGLVFPLLERWDDDLTLIKEYDTNGVGDGNVESTVNKRVKKLFTDNMSITTVKYDANGNMTSEHTGMPFLTAAPGTPSDSSPRCVYVISGTTPGSTLKIYHIVDAAEAKALAKDDDDSNNVAAYNYIAQEETYVLEEEVPTVKDNEGNVVTKGNGVYVWKATKGEAPDTWVETLKWYNDDSQFLPGFSGADFDLTTMSLAELLYKFVPVVFKNMAPVVLNGSVKKILADFLGADFNYVGSVDEKAEDHKNVTALADYDASVTNIFTMPQEDYLWEWSYYEVIGDNHYYRFEDQIFQADLSSKNNYFDIIKWDYKITGDFMTEFVPENGGSKTDTLLMNLNDFIIKVANTALKESAATVDAISGFEAQWTKPALTSGDNSNLVANIKAIAQAVIGLAPQHVFGSDYATNERCYVELMLDADDDTVLTGIAAHIVNMVMPSMSLPGKSQLKASNAKVGAILAAVVREFAAYLAPEYNFDALIYTDFGTTTSDKVKTFVDPEAAGLLSEGQTASGYWFDVILTMGINVGYEYLRAFADMGEDKADVSGVVGAPVNYMAAGGTYAAGTTQATLNAQWEGMLDYIIDWALEKDYEWTWKMENIVDVNNLTIDLATAQDPWVKLDYILNNLLPVDQILNVTATDCETELEQLLRYNLILAIVDLRWEDLADMLKVPDGFVRNANALDSLATVLKDLINGIFAKVGNSSDNFALIPSTGTNAITDFDSLANQANLVAMIKQLVSALYNAVITDGLAATLFPFLNFLLGWKTDPQQIADPVIWTTFRDNNDYAFQWKENGVYPTIEADTTLIKVLNNSAGMLEKHRNSDVTDHAYDIQIKSVTSDAKTNKLTFTYGDGNGLVSPYETLDIKIGGTYNGEEATTITIAYDYVGKNGEAIGGTQYTSITILFSDQYEDSNIDGRFDGDDDKDYTGIDQWKKYQFVEDIFTTVTTFEPKIFGTTTVTGSGQTKNWGSMAAPDYDQDCDGNKTYYNMNELADTWFDYMTTKEEAGWEDSVDKDNPASGFLFKAASGKTVEMEEQIPYGHFDMGRVAVAYGSDNKQWEIEYIHYNDYGIDKIYSENKNNGYNANQGVDSATWEAYRTAWNKIVYLATYPMMTTANSATPASSDYVSVIMPQIQPAIAAYETAKEAYEEALAEAQASGSSASLPAYVQNLQAEIDNDFYYIEGENTETEADDVKKEINFQDFEFYEYFNYNDVKVAAENLYRSYLAPKVMDKYYIQGSGISEAELDLVVEDETNSIIAQGILASRMENDAAAIAASQEAKDNWKQPVTTKLVVDDMTTKLEYYKQFLIKEAEVDLDGDSTAESPAHLYFLNQEIAHVEAQGLDESKYTKASWDKYEKALEVAKTVAAGTDEFSDFNSRIYDVKYNLMVAYKNLLLKDHSLIEKGGTATLEANITKANAIFASLEAGDGEWVLKEDVDADKAYAALISALGYEYQAVYSENDIEVQNGDKQAGDLKYNADGTEMMFNLYADSALEYATYDRPNNQNNQAKVNAANAALEAAIANFEAAVTEPNTIALKEDAPFEAVIDTVNCGDYNGTIYGFDTLGFNDNGEVDGTIAEFITTAYGDDYLEVVVGDSGVETTGTLINVHDADGNVIETYVYVYFGDIDMDGAVGESDAFLASYYELNYEGIDTVAQFMAGDMDGDGAVGEADAFMASYYELNYEGLYTQVELGATNSNYVYEM